MVNMKDVSERAGVSIATVSNVITGKRTVSDKRRRRVLDAIAELNYQVNLVARGLKTQRTNTIGLILPDITKLFFQNVINGILETASLNNYRLNILNSGYNFDTERALVSALRASRVDGIILDSCVPMDQAKGWAEELTAGDTNAVPVVSIESTLFSPKVSSVVLDNTRYSAMITKHLFDIGKRKILYVSGPLDLEHEYARILGYRTCHIENGIPANPKLEKNGGYLSRVGYTAVIEALDEGLDFDAVQASNDQAAIGALKALTERGLRIPKDIAVCGFDNLFPSTLVSPAITTVSVPNYKIGSHAVYELLRRIEDPKSAPKQDVLEAALVIRASTCEDAKSSWDLDGW